MRFCLLSNSVYLHSVKLFLCYNVAVIDFVPIFFSPGDAKMNFAECGIFSVMIFRRIFRKIKTPDLFSCNLCHSIGRAFNPTASQHLYCKLLMHRLALW